MLQKLRNKSRLQGTVEELDYQLEEMLEVLQQGLAELRTKNAEKNLTLAGLRRNGMLAWRPCLETKKLIKAVSRLF